MRSTFHIRSALLAAVLFAELPMHAATAPNDELNNIYKYLPDDTGGVFVVNVKQIVTSPMFTKKLQKRVEELPKPDAIQTFLKDTGLDPLKDITRVIVVMISGTDEKGGPYVVLEGRFDLNKIDVKFKALAKQFPSVLQPLEIAKTSAYQLSLVDEPFAFLVVLDQKTAIIAGTKEQVAEAVEKTAKRKTELKSKSLAKLIAKIDAKDAIAIACAREMAWLSHTAADGPKGTVKPQLFTLADKEIEEVTGSFTIGEEIKGKVIVEVKDADTAKKLKAAFDAGLDEAIKKGAEEAPRRKEVEIWLEIIKGIKASNKEATIMFEGQAGPEFVLENIKGWITFGSLFSEVPPPPPPPAPPPIRKP
jgi:hypothetical protein